MLSNDQIKKYHEDGFLILENVIDESYLQPVRDEVADIVDTVANDLHAAGKIQNLHADAPFEKRLTLLDSEYPGIATMVHVRGILGPQLAKLWSHPALLSVAEQLVGSEVAGHPVWNLRSKTPDNSLATVPWHQDCAYLSPESEHTLQVTAWIPLRDATQEMGCLQVVRGGHKGGVVRHHPEKDGGGDNRSWYLDVREEDLPEGEIVTCEIPAGSVLLMNQLIPHRSTENRSQNIRWSVDLRWQDPRLPSGFTAKEPLLMRTASNPDHRIDWDEWAQDARIDGSSQVNDKGTLEAGVANTWLERWA